MIEMVCARLWSDDFHPRLAVKLSGCFCICLLALLQCVFETSYPSATLIMWKWRNQKA